MVEVKVAGKILALSPMKKEELKGIPIDTKLKFQFYRATFNENAFCLLETKKEENHASIDCLKLAERLKDILHLPVVFLFRNLLFVERNRLIAKDLLSIKAVFFRPGEPFTWADREIPLSLYATKVKIGDRTIRYSELYPEISEALDRAKQG